MSCVEKRMKCYLKYVENILKEPQDILTKKEIKKELLIQISFFQHERMIHLIVTITFAILTMISVAVTLICQNIGIMVLIIGFLILLVPYVRHYYILENGVQKLYEYYDCLKEKE